MIIATLFLAAAAAGSCHARGPLPDASCTPGALNPAVTQATLAKTICRKAGYTRSIRPPVSVTSKIKRERLLAYGLRGPAKGYELDHLVSLELGGAPADVRNLWPEAYAPTPGAHQKDLVENDLKARTCRGDITLAEAQRIIATDWLAYYRQMSPRRQTRATKGPR